MEGDNYLIAQEVKSIKTRKGLDRWNPVNIALGAPRKETFAVNGKSVIRDNCSKKGKSEDRLHKTGDNGAINGILVK